MRLLLVEDDALNVELFTEMLDGEGHQITVERDGPAGRARALRETFDLILLDIHLPGTHGDAICAELRAAGVDTPIVALSASAMAHEMERVRAAGFDAYLTKPIRAAELRRAVVQFGRAGT
jgi:CheY-like chemotaxis protein